MYEDIIQKNSERLCIPPALIRAIITVESGGNSYAIRYEPHYRWLYKPEKIADKVGVTVATEKSLQKHSLGLMQIMGAVARERGFGGQFLTELLEPGAGIKFGCKHVKWQYNRYDNWTDAISAYNQGNNRKDEHGNYCNQWYVNKVLRNWSTK